MADISIIQSGSRYLLGIGSEKVEVSDYKIQSSANGETELCVTIKGVPETFEFIAELEDEKEFAFVAEQVVPGNQCDLKKRIQTVERRIAKLDQEALTLDHLNDELAKGNTRFDYG